MTVETDDLKRLLKDGVSMNRHTLEACLPELVSEVETLRAKNQDLEHALEAYGDPRFMR